MMIGERYMSIMDILFIQVGYNLSRVLIVEICLSVLRMVYSL